MQLERLSLQQRIIAGAMIVSFFSVFLPWASVFGISISGIRGDGIIFLLLAVAGLALLVISSGVFGGDEKPRNKGFEITILVLGALAVLIPLINMSEFSAVGMYIALLAALAWLGASIWQITIKPETAPHGQVNTPPAGYPGAPQAGGYQAPQAGGYQAPQAGGYQAPQAGGYQAPQAGGYQTPPPPTMPPAAPATPPSAPTTPPASATPPPPVAPPAPQTPPEQPPAPEQGQQ